MQLLNASVASLQLLDVSCLGMKLQKAFCTGPALAWEWQLRKNRLQRTYVKTVSKKIDVVLAVEQALLNASPTSGKEGSAATLQRKLQLLSFSFQPPLSQR